MVMPASSWDSIQMLLAQACKHSDLLGKVLQNNRSKIKCWNNGNQKQCQAESIEENTGNPITEAPNVVRDFAGHPGKILLTVFHESGVPI